MGGPPPLPTLILYLEVYNTTNKRRVRDRRKSQHQRRVSGTTGTTLGFLITFNRYFVGFSRHKDVLTVLWSKSIEDMAHDRAGAGDENRLAETYCTWMCCTVPDAGYRVQPGLGTP